MEHFLEGSAPLKLWFTNYSSYEKRKICIYYSSQLVPISARQNSRKGNFSERIQNLQLFEPKLPTVQYLMLHCLYYIIMCQQCIKKMCYAGDFRFLIKHEISYLICSHSTVSVSMQNYKEQSYSFSYSSLGAESSQNWFLQKYFPKTDFPLINRMILP